MSGGKSGGESKDYFGHMAWEFGQGQLDFVWGLLLDNELAWPKAVQWDSQIWKKNTLATALDGNVYQAIAKTDEDPAAGNPDWSLYAIPWVAGTYATGLRKLYVGNVWEVTAVPNTAIAPPLVAPTNVNRVTNATTPWNYLGTPKVFSAGDKYWAADSIVVWKGRIWTTAVGTKTEPGVGGSDWVLWKVDRATSPNPLPITVEDVGDFFLYWGTATQTLDAVGEQVLTLFKHPPYRNKPLLVGNNIKFGTMKTSPPAPVLLAGRSPVQTLVAGAAADLDADWQANPMAVLAELLTHPVIALGLPNSFFDAATWQAQADFFAANPQLYYISPMYTSLSKVKELVVDLLSYPDAFLLVTAAATLAAGRWPHGAAAPAFDATNTVDRDALATEIKWGSSLWSDVATSVEVAFRDWDGGFKSRPVPAGSIFAQNVLRGVQSKKFDRPHIVRASQTMAWANELQKIWQQRKLAGTSEVKQEKCPAVVPGSVFRLTDDVSGVSLTQRATRVVWSKPPTGRRKITHESERGLPPIPYTPTVVNEPASGDVKPSPVRNVHFFQTPSAFGDGPNELTMLATRTTALTSSSNLWYRQKDTNAYQNLGGQSAFAVAMKFDQPINTQNSTVVLDFGVLVQGDLILPGNIGKYAWNLTVQYDTTGSPGDTPVLVDAVEGDDYVYDSNTGQLTIVVGGAITDGSYLSVACSTQAFFLPWDETPSPDLDDLATPLTDDEVADNQLLVFMVKASDPTQFEIASATSFGVGGFGVYYVGLRRAQYGTLMGGDGAYQWTYGDLIFVVKRKFLTPFTHADFKTLQAAAASADFVVTANSAWVKGEITDLQNDGDNPEGLASAWTHTFNNRYAPTAVILSKQKNGADIADWTGRMVLNDVFQLMLGVSDLNGDLAHVSVTIVKADEERQVFSRNYDPTDSTSVTVTWNFPKDGLWRIRVDLLDHAGNQSTTVIPSDGSGIRVDNGNNTSDSPVVYTYDVTQNKVKQLFFGLFRDNNFTVHWQTKARGTAPDAQGAGGGVWTTVTATTAVGGLYKTDTAIPAFNRKTKTLYAYCTHSGGGLGASATVPFNIDK